MIINTFKKIFRHSMKTLFISIVLNFTIYVAFSQDLKTYQIYNKSGDTTSFNPMIKELAAYDVVLFGEYHDHPVIHWLELKTTEALYAKNTNLTLGAEMFETDNQLILDEYLQEKISERNYEEEMRLWDNYNTDYKPLVGFAKSHQLRFIATNAPRRYASAVASFGIDTLNTYSDQAKTYLAELPVKVDTLTPGYSEMLHMMGGAHGAHSKSLNFLEAQALKDATMAEQIAENLSTEGIFLHFNGDYHSKEYGGIYWYLNHLKPDLKIAVISVQQTLNEELSLEPGTADAGHFVIVVPQDFTRTHQ